MPTVVYRARDRLSLQGAVAVLRSVGLSPTILGDPGPRPSGLKVGYLVEIAVPDAEVEQSLRELAAWEATRIHDVTHLTRPVRRWFSMATAVVFLVFVVVRLFFPDHGDTVCLAIPIAAMGGLVLYHYAAMWFPRRKRGD